MLFVYLIFETAKLSREKIRHQFAIDAAAFVEMTNYSDFLNRSAYVNGPFPMRIFYEGFHDTTYDCFSRDPCPGPIHVDDLFFNSGAFPRSTAHPNPSDFQGLDPPVWDIGFGGPRAHMNSDADPGTQIILIDEHTAQFFNINWDDANALYKIYVQIYQLLGSVESAQYSVLDRLTNQTNHSFLQKSYWLNTGGPGASQEGSMAASKFHSSAAGFGTTFHCSQTIKFWANLPTPSHSPKKTLISITAHYPSTSTSTTSNSQGLFQVVTVNNTILNSMKNRSASGYPGWEVSTLWTAPDNYFGVNFNNEMEQGKPMVHTTVSVGVGRFASVWPNPTPKFQTRTFP
jgi:hypothetical protein